MGLWKGSVDSFIQSNTSNLFQAFPQTYEKEDITLTADIAINAENINVSADHGISIGDYLIIYNNYYFWQVEVINVVTNTITLEAPAYLPFLQSNTTVISGSTDMNVNGSVTPVLFKWGIPSMYGKPIDITRIMPIMTYSVSQGDDGDFGNLDELTNGLLVRKENDQIINLGVYRKNLDFKTVGAEINYNDTSPGGTYGLNVNFYLQGQQNFDQVLRFKYEEFFTLSVRDDLTDLDYFRIPFIGSYTVGE